MLPIESAMQQIYNMNNDTESFIETTVTEKGRYTPGPWLVSAGAHNFDPNPLNGVYDSMGPSICAADRNGGGDWFIARIEGSAPDRDANARLIAAAPELLEALELLLSGYEGLGGDMANNGPRIAREAIAKATA